MKSSAFHLLTFLLFLLLSREALLAQGSGTYKTLPAVLKLDAKATLGEGALFDDQNKLFYWVDIEEGILYWCDYLAENCQKFSFGKRIGTVVPCQNKNEVAVALEDGIYLFNTSSKELKLLCTPEKGKTGNRFNDGKCSPAGNFWVGSMSTRGASKAGALYRVKGDGSYSKMIDSVGTSNGIVWDVKRKKMYYIDTPTSLIMEYSYDEIKDTISSPRVCVRVPHEMGYPDGMTIDADGRLWVAHWSGAGVYCWDPGSGFLLIKIEIPARNVTSCAFAGEQQEALYVTTARIGNSDQTLQTLPLSGGLFMVYAGARGTACNYFKTK